MRWGKSEFKGSSKTRLPEDETSWFPSRSPYYEAINLCQSFQGIHVILEAVI